MMNDPQPKPITNEGRPIWELVIEDMRVRDMRGFQKYRTRLQASNGRNALIDAYQEALDLCVYLRQRIEEDTLLASAVPDPKEVLEEIEQYVDSRRKAQTSRAPGTE